MIDIFQQYGAHPYHNKEGLLPFLLSLVNADREQLTDFGRGYFGRFELRTGTNQLDPAFETMLQEVITHPDQIETIKPYGDAHYTETPGVLGRSAIPWFHRPRIVPIFEPLWQLEITVTGHPDPIRVRACFWTVNTNDRGLAAHIFNRHPDWFNSRQLTDDNQDANIQYPPNHACTIL